MTGGEPARTAHDDLFSTPAAPVADALTPAWPERAAWGTAPSLRAWQSAALRDYLARQPRDFLAALEKLEAVQISHLDPSVRQNAAYTERRLRLQKRLGLD